MINNLVLETDSINWFISFFLSGEHIKKSYMNFTAWNFFATKIIRSQKPFGINVLNTNAILKIFHAQNSLI